MSTALLRYGAQPYSAVYGTVVSPTREVTKENIAMIELVSAEKECEVTEMQFDGGRRERQLQRVFPLIICCHGPWRGIVSYLRD